MSAFYKKKKYKMKKMTMREKRMAMQQLLFSQAFRTGLVVVVVAFSFLNVFQITKVSTTGYKIADLQKEIRELTHENDRLDVQIAEHRSMVNIEERLAHMNFVSGGTVEYVTLPGTAVAVR